MAKTPAPDEMSEQEIAARRDAALARALTTRPKQYGDYKGKSTKPDKRIPKPKASPVS